MKTKRTRWRMPQPGDMFRIPDGRVCVVKQMQFAADPPKCHYDTFCGQRIFFDKKEPPYQVRKHVITCLLCREALDNFMRRFDDPHNLD